MSDNMTIDWRERDSAVLSDLYDGDRHLIAERFNRAGIPEPGPLRVNRHSGPPAPHPLIGVQYADGIHTWSL